MSDLYFKHTQTGNVYPILAYDKETNMLRLKGKHVEFEEPFDKTRLKLLGYDLRKKEPEEKEDGGQ